MVRAQLLAAKEVVVGVARVRCAKWPVGRQFGGRVAIKILQWPWNMQSRSQCRRWRFWM